METKTGLSSLPILQGTPATVGIPGSHTVATAPPLVTLGHFHPQHLHVCKQPRVTCESDRGTMIRKKIFMRAGLPMDGIPQCLGWMLILANRWISDVCVELKWGEVRKIRRMWLLLWFCSHGQPLITETEATYSHGERSWDKGSCCHWGQRSWGGAPLHWLAAWASTGWPRSCSPRRWAVNGRGQKVTLPV